MNKGFKQTEIGWLPEEWEVKTAKMIGKVFGGLSGKSKKDFSKGNSMYIPFMNIMKNPIIDTNNLERVFVYNGETQNKALKGDLFFNGSSETPEEVGMCSVLLDTVSDLYLNSFCFGFRLNNLKVSHGLYLSYFFRSSEGRKIFYSLAQGATRYNLSKANFLKLEFPLPPLAEQTRIARILSDTDALLQALDALIAKKKDIKQAAMQQLLMPKEGWVVRKLGEVLKIRHGKDQKGVEDRNGKYPILGTGGLMGYASHFLYNKPSVLIGRKGTIDKPRYMNSPFWTVDTLFYSEINFNYNPKYLFYLFNTIGWYSYNEASGVPSLNAKTIENIEKSFPPLTEQTRIAQILTDMDNEIAALEAKAKKYRDIKQGLMQQLLTGKIRTA